jgi:hypothetical protein
MPTLLVVGAGLFGSLAAGWARHRGLEVEVFDPGLPGAASPAAAGLFKEDWAGGRLREHYLRALPVLERLYGVGTVSLRRDDGVAEPFLFVPPRLVLEPHPARAEVTAVGDGWVETAGGRREGWVYVAAGVWCERFFPGLGVHGRAGSAYLFAGERPGRTRALGPRRQAHAFVRDPGTTYFSDGTAERLHAPAHDDQTLGRAADMGLVAPVTRLHGARPYAPGGVVFRKLGSRLWLATGGRKMGTILGASCARLLVDEGLRQA